MKKCSVPECGARATARGLCPKHYMRARRHGDAQKVLKAGRKPDYIASLARKAFDDHSPRTQARFARALRLGKRLEEGTGDPDITNRAIKAASRANGSVNVSMLEESLDSQAAAWIALNFPDE